MSEIKHRVILGMGPDVGLDRLPEVAALIRGSWPDVDVIVHGGVGTVVLPGPGPEVVVRQTDLEPERQKLARTVLDFIPQMTAFTDAVVAAIRDLDGSHYPTTYGDGRPELCAVCGAADGSWPCVARQVADDLRRAIGDE